MDTSVLQDLLSDDAWNDVFSFDDVNDSVEFFMLMLRALLDMLVPLHTIHVKQHVNL